MREAINQIKEEWTKEKEELTNNLKGTEDRMAKMKKGRIRNNLIITGIDIGAKNEEVLRDRMEKKSS